jgi:hypothetical protein
LKAYQRYLEDPGELNGEILECSADKMIPYDLPELGNGRVTKRAVTVWEPFFKLMHGEHSGLPDSIE